MKYKYMPTEEMLLNWIFKDIFENPMEHREECYNIMIGTLVVRMNKIADGFIEYVKSL